MDAKKSAVVSRRLTINDKLYEKTLVFSYIDNSQRELSLFFIFIEILTKCYWENSYKTLLVNSYKTLLVNSYKTWLSKVVELYLF